MSVLAELAVDAELDHVPTTTADDLEFGQGIPGDEEGEHE
jgi:hypothetical protein